MKTSTAVSLTNSEAESPASIETSSQSNHNDGEQQKSVNNALPGWRVKLYQLNKEGQWDDHGTGQVSCRLSDENSCEAYLSVLSEDTDDKRQRLFWGKVACGAGVYQRQRDTIITWQQPDMMVDLALSFQDVEGCQDIWDALQMVEQKYNQMIAEDNGTEESTIQGCGRSQTSEDTADSAHGLPPVSTEHFNSIVHAFDVAISQAQGKAALSHFLLDTNPHYIEDVLDVFESFQKNGDKENIILGFKVLWAMFRLNDPAIISYLLSDSIYLRVANVIDVGLEIISYSSGQSGQSRQKSDGKDVNDPVEPAASLRSAGADAANQDSSMQERHGERCDAGQMSKRVPTDRNISGEQDGIAPMDINHEDDETSTGSTSVRSTEKTKSLGVTGSSKYVSIDGSIEYGKGQFGQHLTGSQFKQVAPIADPLTLEKIHTNFRILTLMDVVQAVDQMLNGPLHQCFLGIVAQNSEEVIRSLANDDIFMDGLFRAMNKGMSSQGTTIQNNAKQTKSLSVSKPQTRAEFLACTTRLDALRCLQEMWNQARQMQQRTSAILYDKVVQFEWKDAAEQNAREKVFSGNNGIDSPSIDSTPSLHIGANAYAAHNSDEVHNSSSAANSKISVISSQLANTDASSPTVFLGIMSSILGGVDTSTKELLVATDLLLSLVLHAPVTLQRFVIESGAHPHASLNSISAGVTGLPTPMTCQGHGNPHVFCSGKLLQHICARLIGDNEESVQLTCLEILKAVLDPTRMDDTKEEFLGIFYDHYIAQIVGSLGRKLGDAKRTESPNHGFTLNYALDHQNSDAMCSSHVHVLEFLCFAVEHHTYRIKYCILRQNIVGLAFRLLDCPQKYVQLAAIRFGITCIKQNENFYNR